MPNKVDALRALLGRMPPLEDTVGAADPKEIQRRMGWLKFKMLEHRDPEQLLAPHGEWGWKMTSTDAAGNDVPDLNIDYDSWKAHVRENLSMHPPVDFKWAEGGKVGTVTQLITKPTRDFHSELMAKVRNRSKAMAEAVANTQYKYNVGDKVRGAKGAYEITGRMPPKDDGVPRYMIKMDLGNGDYAESSIPETGLLGGFGGPTALKADGGRVHYRGSKPATPEDELTVGDSAPTPGLKGLRDAARALTGGGAGHDYAARVLRSLVTNFSTMGKDGHPTLPGIRGKVISAPGLVDGAMSTPELLPLVGQLLKAGDERWPSHSPVKDLDMGFDAFANYDTPQWSKDASSRYAALDDATRVDMGLSRPRGFGEHAADAAGMMLGQIPLAGPAREAGVAAKGLKGVLGAVPEYLGPTVKPSLGAYSQGAVGGGILGTIGDPNQDTESNATHWAKGGHMTIGNLRNKYADGGKIGKSQEAIKAIKNAMSHLANRDSQSAVQALTSNKEAASDPNVKAAIDDLTKAKAQSAAQRLNMLLESDSNSMSVPLLAKGGSVDGDPAALSFEDFVKSLA